MAGQGGRSSFDLRFDLLQEGHSFSFYQAVRLLRLFAAASNRQSTSGETKEQIRIRPHLSLAFPPADIERVEENPEGTPRFLITATLLGLYGPSSPLPTFYTEDLMDEAAADESVTREFVDILNHRLFLLLVHAWAKYRLFVQVVEQENPRDLKRLFALLGLFPEAIREDVPDAYGLLRYIGLFSQFPRSSVGLKSLLQDALGQKPVDIAACVAATAKIPEAQRLRLGDDNCALGVQAFLGEQIQDRMGKFRIRIGPLTGAQFQDLLPGGGGYQKLAFLTGFYVTDPLEYDVELTLAEGQVQGVRLGGRQWSRLGWDTWIFAQSLDRTATVTFFPQAAGS